jgi:hypothetical protein
MYFDFWLSENYNDICNLYSIFYNNMNHLGFTLENNNKLFNKFCYFLYETTEIN